jgi:hypothetical protein
VKEREMGGSGGGGGFSSSDMQKIQEAAEARLRALASNSTKVLFICEDGDKNSLDVHLAKSTVFKKGRFVVIEASQAAELDAVLDATTFVVFYTEAVKAAPFIDIVIDKATAKKIGGVHVKGNSGAIIPSKITAYRMRSITWRELEAIFK